MAVLILASSLLCHLDLERHRRSHAGPQDQESVQRHEAPGGLGIRLELGDVDVVVPRCVCGVDIFVIRYDQPGSTKIDCAANQGGQDILKPEQVKACDFEKNKISNPITFRCYIQFEFTVV